jgi:hypothetical protein
LLAMSGLRDEYLMMRLNDGEGVSGDSALPARSLRHYLYDKYVYRNTEQRPDCQAESQNDGAPPQELRQLRQPVI